MNPRILLLPLGSLTAGHSKGKVFNIDYGNIDFDKFKFENGNIEFNFELDNIDSKVGSNRG